MSMRCGCGIHKGCFRLHPWSGHFSAHGTGGNADTSIAADTFHLPRVREGVDIQDTLLFSKPDRGLDGRPIPFETLQVQILLIRKESEVGARHGHAFMLDPVRMCACHIVPGMRILSVQSTAEVSDTLRRHAAYT